MLKVQSKNRANGTEGEVTLNNLEHRLAGTDGRGRLEKGFRPWIGA